MKPVSPVLPASGTVEVIYGEAQQAKYIPLRAFQSKFAVLTRWHLTDDERRHIAQGGDLFISLLNGGPGMPIMAIMPLATDPDSALKWVLEMEEQLQK